MRGNHMIFLEFKVTDQEGFWTFQIMRLEPIFRAANLQFAP